jgi:hypothetical protein
MALLIQRSAVQPDSQQVKGLGSALRSLREHPGGEALLAAIGLGLAVYGLYSFVLAAFRRIYGPL